MNTVVPNTPRERRIVVAELIQLIQPMGSAYAIKTQDSRNSNISEHAAEFVLALCFA